MACLIFVSGDDFGVLDGSPLQVKKLLLNFKRNLRSIEVPKYGSLISEIEKLEKEEIDTSAQNYSRYVLISRTIPIIS